MRQLSHPYRTLTTGYMLYLEMLAFEPSPPVPRALQSSLTPPPVCAKVSSSPKII